MGVAAHGHEDDSDEELPEIKLENMDPPIYPGRVKLISYYILLSYLIANLDNGAVPGSVKEIKDYFNYDDK